MFSPYKIFEIFKFIVTDVFIFLRKLLVLSFLLQNIFETNILVKEIRKKFVDHRILEKNISPKSKVNLSMASNFVGSFHFICNA